MSRPRSLTGLFYPALILFSFALGCARSGPVNTHTPDPAADEPSLTTAQSQWINDVLAETDKLDSLYRKGVKDSHKYLEAEQKAEARYFEGKSLLSEKDSRAVLLSNVMDAYQQSVVLIVGKAAGRAVERPDALMAIAGIRKVLLKKINAGTLTPQEKAIVDELRKEWRK